MGAKQKKTFRDETLKAMKGLDDAKYLPDADFDAIARAQNALAIGAGLRKPMRRKKTLDQQIQLAETQAAAKAAREKVKEEQAKKRRASAKKRRDVKAKAKEA